MAQANSNGFELQDSSWLRQSIFRPGRGTPISTKGRGSVNHIVNKPVSNQFNFKDTALGGNESINPLPQFTRFADINLPSKLSETVDSTKRPGNTKCYGMGRRYSELIDSNSKRIYMQFGIQMFNGLLNYFSNFYDSTQGNIVNSGRINADMYAAGKVVGYVTTFAMFPVFSSVRMLLQWGGNQIGKAIRMYAELNHVPLSKYYYVKPTMALYWSAVQYIVNQLAANLGLGATKIMGEDKTPIENKLLPDLFNDEGTINIARVATRYHRLCKAHNNALDKLVDKNDNWTDIIAAAKKYTDSPAPIFDDDITAGEGGKKEIGTFSAFFNHYCQSVAASGKWLLDEMTTDSLIKDTKSAIWQSLDKMTGTNAPIDDQNKNSEETGEKADIEYVIDDVTKLWAGVGKHLSEYSKYYESEVQGGLDFVGFRVEHEQSISESFSNTSKQSDIMAAANSTVSSIRSKIYDFSGGNLGTTNMSGGVLGGISDMLTGITSMLTGAFQAGADAVGLSGVAALMGRAYIEMPEYYDQSSASFPSHTYTMKLRSWSGDPLMVLTNVLIPTAMVLAGGLPRSTGRNSYSGPFLCKLWERGKAFVEVGMIESISLNRCTGNVGMNLNGLTTGIDLTFTIKNLSTIMHCPITTVKSEQDLLNKLYKEFGFEDDRHMFDEPTEFTNYLGVLAGLSLHDNYYPYSSMGNFGRRIKAANMNFEIATSQENIMARIAPGLSANSLIGSGIGMLLNAMEGYVDPKK